MPRKESSHQTRARAIILGIGFILLAPASTFASGIELRLGGFAPRGDSDLFADVNELFGVGRRGVGPRDFRGFSGGIEYSFGVGDHVELGVSLDGYGRTVRSSYRGYEHDDGSPIFQDRARQDERPELDNIEEAMRQVRAARP